jgi:hypothetical protein
MICVASEHVFPVRELSKHVPRRRGGKRLAPSTGYRWAKYGVNNQRLETICVGGTLCTSREALQRFFESLSANRGPPPHPPLPMPPAPRQDDERIAQQLDRLGL